VIQHLDWSPTPGATSYDGELDGTLVCVDRTSPGCSMYALPWGAHIWRVIAKNGPCTVAGPTWGLFNALFPSSPQPSSPPNGSSACSVQTVSWSPSLYAEWYTVELDDTVVCTTYPPATSCATGPLSPGQHTWKVYIHSFCEIYGNPGPEWSFTIDSCGAASEVSAPPEPDRSTTGLDR
jgi:hypothetical protein